MSLKRLKKLEKRRGGDLTDCVDADGSGTGCSTDYTGDWRTTPLWVLGAFHVHGAVWEYPRNGSTGSTPPAALRMWDSNFSPSHIKITPGEARQGLTHQSRAILGLGAHSCCPSGAQDRKGQWALPEQCQNHP